MVDRDLIHVLKNNLVFNNFGLDFTKPDGIICQNHIHNAVAKLPGWQGVAAATPQKMLATPLATQVVRSVSNIHLLNGIIFFATEAVDLIGNLFKFKN